MKMETTKNILTVFAVLFTLAVFGGVAAMLALSLAQAEETILVEPLIEARYDGARLSVEIPFSRTSSGILRGKISCKLVDMEEKTIAEVEKNVVLRLRKDSVRLNMPLEVKPEELAATRIKYSFIYDKGEASGIVATEAVTDWLEVHLLGQSKLLSGSNASVRVVALNHRSMEPVSDATVNIALLESGKRRMLYSGKTGSSGSVDATLRLPEIVSEEAKLEVRVKSPVGEETIERSVKLARVFQTYLVTDKPMYQPNQTIQMRTITLAKPSMLPMKGQDITFEILDSKGNKIFKKKTKTDEFGVSYAQFRLADEINKGRYKIQALIGEDKTEKTVTVEQYVLPKFNVTLKTDKEYYAPGDKLKGTISAAYFFGKPVAGGKVKIALSKFDVGFTPAGELTGKTDKEGVFEFDIGLPDYFIGQPLEQGDAFVKIDLEVEDLAEHKEEKSETRIVAGSSIRITLIPEGGQIVPGVKNRVYCMTTYPDGRPVLARVTLNEMEGFADSMGVSTFEVQPTQEKEFTILVTANDKQGNTATLTRNFTYNIDAPHLLLRLDKAIYKVGSVMNVTVFSNKRSGTIYLDMIKDGQTMLTKSMVLKSGKAEAAVSLVQDLSGTVKVHAYIVGMTSDVARDTRTIYVNPANDLLIEITPDRPTYRPGDDGTIQFTVTDRTGTPVVSAIGASIVDEAVFALTEMQPGMEKVYFTLEKEIMTPRYEIHDFTPEEIVIPLEQDTRRQKAATVLFASFQEPPKYTIDVNTYEALATAFLEKAYSRMLADLEKLRRGVGQFRNEKRRVPSKSEGLEPVVRAGFLKESDLLDPWGTPYEIIAGGNDLSWFEIRSWGPDKKKDTSDDFSPSYMREEGLHIRGGRGGEPVFMGAMEMDAMAPAPMKKGEAKSAPAEAEATAVAEPRIRQYFPETMLFKPDLVTDRKGTAKINVKWADSITEWRLTSTASSGIGQLGSRTKGIVVFQDFFVDIDLPVSLTQGDEVSIPIAVYNYLKGPQSVKLVLEKENWFDLLSDETVTKTLKKDEVSVVYFRLKVKGIGVHPLTVKAYGSQMSDAISREIEVLPDGELVLTSVSDRLEGRVEKKVSIPDLAIDGPSKILVKVFPGIFSQIVDGLESMLRMPFGCFEQTSSVTYPNILILDYMRKTDQATPETDMKAQGFISVGYQRLLSFEVPGGGFEWFGNHPANKLLTAYGLMEFKDMSRVYEIDENLIERTRQWLLSQQEKDGSFKPDASYLHAESWTRIQKNEILPTAYISWSLLESGDRSEQVERAVKFLKENLNQVEDPYMLSLCANALASWDRNDAATDKVFKMLQEKAIEEKGAVYWKSSIPTFTHSHGDAADIETTALVAFALVKYGKMQNLTNKVLTYLIRAKDASGMWGGTQATVMALRALLASLGGSTEDVDAKIAIRINGQDAEALRLTKENADVMKLVDLKEFTKEGTNDVSIELSGKGSCLYEVVAKYYVPWKRTPEPVKELLSIDVDYDRTELSQNDLVTCNVKVANNRPGIAHMVIVDLGVPPGFEVQAGDLAELVGTKIEKYNLTSRQVIIYLEKIEEKKPVEFSYRLRAKFPLKAKTTESRAYEYYNPEIEAVAQPVDIVVK
jgi:uncharacterized protein YfaS (alpha-2-macroglobulin family)